MFALILLSPLTLVQSFGSLPSRIYIAGVLDVQAPPSGWTNGTYSLVPSVTVGSQVDQFSVLQSTALSFDGTTLTITNTYTEATPTKAQLLAYTQQKRLQKELGGTTINTVFVPTDVQTQARILNAYVNATANSAYTINWVKTDGTTVTLTATQVINSAKQVGAFIEQCRNTEITLDSQINAGTTTTTAQVDSAFAAFS